MWSHMETKPLSGWLGNGVPRKRSQVQIPAKTGFHPCNIFRLRLETGKFAQDLCLVQFTHSKSNNTFLKNHAPFTHTTFLLFHDRYIKDIHFHFNTNSSKKRPTFQDFLKNDIFSFSFLYPTLPQLHPLFPKIQLFEYTLEIRLNFLAKLIWSV